MEAHVFTQWTTTAHTEERIGPTGTKECDTLLGPPGVYTINARAHMPVQ